jgi:hypothetical protein
MKNINWREMVEIVGLVSIVGSLLLLATEVRQSNKIASAEMEMTLSEGFMQIQLQRTGNLDVAKLWAKITEPEGQLITATDRSQMRGLTWTYVNLFWMVQSAHDNDLMSDAGFEEYVDVVRWILEFRPALRDHFIFVYETTPAMVGVAIFAPVEDLIRERSTDNQ